jgi:hypothetical protein
MAYSIRCFVCRTAVYSCRWSKADGGIIHKLNTSQSCCPVCFISACNLSPYLLEMYKHVKVGYELSRRGLLTPTHDTHLFCLCLCDYTVWVSAYTVVAE